MISEYVILVRSDVYMNNNESCHKTSINCLITIYLRTSANPYFIRNYKNFDNAYFI